MRIFKSKKGQGLTLNTIIIAALVVIVLVVLIMIFTGRMNLFGSGVRGLEADCASHGGKTCNSCPTSEQVTYKDPNTGQTKTPETTKGVCCHVTSTCTRI